MRKEKYEIITYNQGLKLKLEKQGEFFKSISFNNAQVFVLQDSSFLILPLNPFSASLHVYEREYLEGMINSNVFPVKEKINSFYDSNKEKIGNLDIYGKALIDELEEFLRINNFVSEKDCPDIDSIFRFLKTKKSLGKYKLNFIVFLANFIIKNHDQHLKIGLLRDRQTLNPIVSIVLVKKVDSSMRFFNLEDHVFGKYEYFGIQGLLNSLAEFKRKANNVIYVIDKVFDWPDQADFFERPR